jgi:Raf kinase inhibitor-like YbhB/YbcL family protein
VAIDSGEMHQAGEQMSPSCAGQHAAGRRLHANCNPDAHATGPPNDQAHWVVWNIPATATGLPEGVPSGAERPDGSRQTSASGPVYRGPGAPANGPVHHYTFEIYALDAKLDVSVGTDAFETRAAVMKAMQGHILGKAVYVGLFRRPQ